MERVGERWRGKGEGRVSTWSSVGTQKFPQKREVGDGGGRREKGQESMLRESSPGQECKGAGKTLGKLSPTSGPRRAWGPGRRARPLLSPAASGLLETAASCALGGMRAGVLPGSPCIHAPPLPARPSSGAEPGPRGLSREQVREQGGVLASCRRRLLARRKLSQSSGSGLINLH